MNALVIEVPAGEPVKFKLTQKHIDKARQLINIGLSIACYCPLAICIKERLKLKYEHSISVCFSVAIKLERGYLTVLLPSEVNRWRQIFDNGGKVKPIEFTLTIPKELIP